jgi:hypothetical protein
MIGFARPFPAAFSSLKLPGNYLATAVLLKKEFRNMATIPESGDFRGDLVN